MPVERATSPNPTSPSALPSVNAAAFTDSTVARSDSSTWSFTHADTSGIIAPIPKA